MCIYGSKEYLMVWGYTGQRIQFHKCYLVPSILSLHNNILNHSSPGLNKADNTDCMNRFLYSNLCFFVWLFVCPIITQKPLDRFASNLIEEIGSTTGMFL